MKQLTYTPVGTCSRCIDIQINDSGTIENVTFTGGCNGNLQGIARLVKGLTPQQVISKVEGIRCGSKNTSCPDQLAQALKNLL